MKEFRSGDLVPDCDEAIRYDCYEDLLFQVVAQAPDGVSELVDALSEQLRPDVVGD
jgi:hypothetical protein